MRKIIIDTDIGDDIDDAFALLTALANKNDEILGITTVFKNTPQRAHIVKSLLAAAGREVPVYAGHEKPLSGKIIRWDYEKTDSDGKIRIHHFLDSMRAAKYEEGSAEDFILNTAKKYPHEVTLIAIGPFMNVAKAIEKDKAAFSLLKEICVMCGQPEKDYPEWNIRVDPEAADMMFHSGVPIRCTGLNVTTKCRLLEPQIKRVCSYRAEAVQLVARMMKIWIESNNKSGQLTRYPTMHDPLCVLASQYEGICKFERRHFKICMEGARRAFMEPCEDGFPVDIAVSVDVEAFYERFFEAIETFEKKEEL